MPSMPLHRSRKSQLLVAAACVFGATLLAGCATTSSGALVATAPTGIDLSGEWRLNEDLSDDPQRMEEPKEALPPKEEAPERNPGGFGRPGGMGPGGGIDPRGNNLTNAAGPASGLLPVLYQTTDLPSSSSDGAPAKPVSKAAARASTVNRMLDAPALLQISQSGSKVVVKSMADGKADEYTAGEQRTIPFGQTQADRSAGWRDAAFVVITKAHKGPSKEDDFALDSEGHLIFATLVTHVRKGPIDFKRVYDRVRTPN